MRCSSMVLAVCLWACGDNELPSSDAAPEVQRFHPAGHAPMPLVLQHAGIVLSTVQLVTITFDDYADRAQVEAFGNAIVGSSWYRSAGLEYGLNPGTHLQLTLGHAPKSLTRDQLEAQIKQLLTGNIASKQVATDAQPLYMLYVPPTVTRGMGLADRGYHDSIMVGNVRVPIVVVLDDGSGLATTTLTAARLLINAAANPYRRPMDGYYVDPQTTDPWSLVLGELADLCDGEDPIVEDGFTLPKVYSNRAAAAGKSPCKPFVPDDTWSDVSAEPSKITMIPKGGSVTYRLTGWSTRELPDWKLHTHVADLSQLTEDEMRPELSSDTINNNRSVTLTLHAPATAASGTVGGVYVLSGDKMHPWAAGFVVQ